jgi:glutamyl-tRNA reductase
VAGKPLVAPEAADGRQAMSILLIGLSYRTAPVEVREQLAFDSDGAAAALSCFHQRFPGCEAAILSTCNRMELLIASDGDQPATSDVIRLLAEIRDLPAAHFAPHLYQFSGEQACRHFFHVAAGLDSMVLGEYQIMHQVKQAYHLARQQQTTGRILNRLFHHAFESSKRIRTETAVSRGKLSIPSAAVDLLRVEPNVSQTLIVGSGQTARVVCRHLVDAGNAGRIVVTSRTLEHADTLAADCHVAAAPIDQLDEQLCRSDRVILAVTCPEPILSADRVRRVMSRRQGRPLLLVDLCVPRSVAAEAARVPGVTLHDIDAVGKVVAENEKSRAAALNQCERILDEETAAFEQWLNESRLAPLIEQIYSDARRIRDAELETFLAGSPDLTERQKKAVTQLMDRLVGKFMHPCVMGLRHGMNPAMEAAAGSFRTLASRCTHACKHE